MFCPFKMANSKLASHYIPEAGYYSEQNWECEKELCGLWNERFGQCALAVDGYLKGQEDWRKERGSNKD